MTLQRIKYTIKGGEDRVISKNQMRNFLMFFCVYVFKPILKPQIEKKVQSTMFWWRESQKGHDNYLFRRQFYNLLCFWNIRRVWGSGHEHLGNSRYIKNLKSSQEICKVQATK